MTIRFEIKKILQSKLLWVMVSIAIALDVALIFTSSYEQPNAVYLAQVAEQTGTKITAESYKKLESIYNSEAEKLEGIKVGRPISQEQNTAQIHTFALENWMGSAGAFLEEKPVLDKKELLEGRLEGIKDPAMRDLLTKQFGQFEPRLNEINKSGELEWLGANLEYFGTHSLLFGKLLPIFYLEMVFIGAFLLLNSMNFEFSLGTDQIVYASRRGRKIQRDKFLAVFFITTGLYLILGACLLTGFFSYYRQWVFLDVPIAAPLYGGYISKAPFTLLSYLFSNLAAGYALLCVFLLLAYCFGNLKGQFVSLGGFLGTVGCLFGAGALSYAGFSTLPRLLPAYNPVSMLVSINPADSGLQWNVDSWFCFGNNAASMPYYILITLTLWLLLTGIGALLSKRLFLKRSL